MRGDCYIIIYGYANLRFNNNDSQLKDGKRAKEEEEEQFSKTRCHWFDVLATYTMVCRG